MEVFRLYNPGVGLASELTGVLAILAAYHYCKGFVILTDTVVGLFQKILAVSGSGQFLAGVAEETLFRRVLQSLLGLEGVALAFGK